MFFGTNEYANRMWTDERYRVEVTECQEREADGASRLSGWLVPREPTKRAPALSKVPFRVTIPTGLGDFDFHRIMATMYNRLQAGLSLLEGLDFAPEPQSTPVPVQAAINWGGVALVVLGAFIVGATVRR